MNVNVKEAVGFALDNAHRASETLERKLREKGKTFFDKTRIGLFSPVEETRNLLCAELQFRADETIGRGLYVCSGIQIFVADTDPALTRGNTLCAAFMDAQNFDSDVFRNVYNSTVSCRLFGYSAPILVL